MISPADREEFKNWFGNSKVVNEAGEPIVVYHSTRSEKAIAKFRIPAYFSDSPEFAGRFNKRAVYPVYLKIERPYVMDGALEGRHFEWSQAEIAEFQAAGYNGIIIEHEDGNIYTPFNQASIKSATGNRGTFAHTARDIRFDRQVPTEKRVDKTETAAFKAWFDGSKIVDETGKPRVMYHSTVADFSRFKRMPKDLGFHFGTAGQAEDRFLAKSKMDPFGPQLRGVQHSTMPVYLSIKNPLRLPDVGFWDGESVYLALREIPGFESVHSGMTSAKIRDVIKAKGYDGIVYQNAGETGGAAPLRQEMEKAWRALWIATGKARFTDEEKQHPLYVEYSARYDAYHAFKKANREDSYIAFEPGQVKSALSNNGDYNRKNPDIRFARPDAQPEETLSFLKYEYPVLQEDLLSAEQLAARGVSYRLTEAVERYIPVDKIDLREPSPAPSDAIGFVPGRPIEHPVEVVYDAEMDIYRLHAGTRRVAQAVLNGDPLIRAFVQPENGQLGEAATAIPASLNVHRLGVLAALQTPFPAARPTESNGNSPFSLTKVDDLPDAFRATIRQMEAAARSEGKFTVTAAAMLDDALGEESTNNAAPEQEWKEKVDLKALKQAAIDATEAFRDRLRNPGTVDQGNYFEFAGKSHDAKQALRDGIVDLPDDGFALCGHTRDGRLLLLNASAQRSGYWQLTRFDSAGEPWGDTQYETKRQAVGDFLSDIDLKTLDDMNQSFSAEAAAKYSRALSEVPSPVFYSALARTIPDIRKIASKDGTVAAEQTRAWIAARQKEGKFKAAEVEWSGLADWLAVTPERLKVHTLIQFVEANGVQVHEVIKGAPDYSDVEAWWNDESGANEETPFAELCEQEVRDAAQRYADEVGQYNEGDSQTPKYGQYTLPGGEHYRELLLMLPTNDSKIAAIEAKWNSMPYTDPLWQGLADERQKLLRQKKFKSGHWEEPNVLAHVRFNERTDAQGSRVLFIEEIQSDWAQIGKREGFGAKLKSGWRMAEQEPGFFLLYEDGYTMPRAHGSREAVLAAAERMGGVFEGVPAAPFVDDTKAWVSLAIKRMLRYAAEHGFDKVAFVNGEQSAKRYDLSRAVNAIAWQKNGDGTYNVEADTLHGEPIVQRKKTGDELERLLGKEVTKKILEGAGKFENDAAPVERGRLSGVDLEVGGEGMKAFYDHIVPQVANEILRRLGEARISDVSIVHEEAIKAIARGEVGSVDEMSDDFQYQVQLGFAVTPMLRAAVLQGQPLFSRIRVEEGEPGPVFYSALAAAVKDMRSIARKDGKIATAQAVTWLAARQKEGRFKAAEFAWTGLGDFLSTQGDTVDLAAILAYVEANGVQIHEVHKASNVATEIDREWNAAADAVNRGIREGLPEEELERLRDFRDGLRVERNRAADAPVETKFAEYTLPGGDNYREILLTLPKSDAKKTVFKVRVGDTYIGTFDRKFDAEGLASLRDPRAKVVEKQVDAEPTLFSSGHWDEANVLCHMRLNERETADGKRVLFVEEVQSDWAQIGKKTGFQQEPVLTEQENGKWLVSFQDGRRFGEYSDKADALVAQDRAKKFGGKTSRAPFVTDTKSWVALAIKRLIRLAAEEGFDTVAFINGQQSSHRYDLSKRIESIEYRVQEGKSEGGLKAYDHAGEQVMSEIVPIDRLDAYIGKEAAARLMESEGPGIMNWDGKVYVLSGENMKVGGDGMVAFYDQIVPQVANDVLKKLGGGKLAPIDLSRAAGYRVDDDGVHFNVVDNHGDRVAQYSSQQSADAYIRDLRAGIGEQLGFDITPALRTAVLQGQPLFSRITQPIETSQEILWSPDLISATGGDEQRAAQRAGSTLFHITPAENVDSILQDGLVPRVGSRSAALGEATDAVYLFSSVEALEDGMSNWLTEQFDEDQQLALLAVDPAAVNGLRVTDGAEFEVTAQGAIPPASIRVVTRDIDAVPDLRSAIAATEASSPSIANSVGSAVHPLLTNENGKPLVVYHGTDKKFDTLQTQGFAAYFSSSHRAASSYGDRVIAANLRLHDPLVVDAKGSDWQSIPYTETLEALSDSCKFGFSGYEDGTIDTDTLVALAKRVGHDGLIVLNVDDGPGFDSSIGLSTVYAAFEDPQIATRTDINALHEWLGNSVVLDQHGGPLVVYRGEHGDSNGPVQTRRASITFGSLAAANTYAMHPNDRADRDGDVFPRVIPAYLKIENPIIQNDDDCFIDLCVLDDALGRDRARQVALKFAPFIEDTGNWAENFASQYDSVEALLAEEPYRLRELYLDAYRVLDDAEVVQWLKEAGYDGAVHQGNAETFGEAEYRVFDRSQIKSALGDNPTFAEPTADTSANVTETAAFRKWFDGSRIVGPDGAPLVVYHGTNQSFDKFQSFAPTQVYRVDGEEVHRADSWDMGEDRTGNPDWYHYGALSDALTLGPEAALEFRRAERDRLNLAGADTARALRDLERLAGKQITVQTESRPSGDGFYFTPDRSYSFIRDIGRYPGGNVMPVYLSIRNPVFLNASQIEGAGASFNIEKYKAQGYDGAIYAENPEDLTRRGWGGSVQIVAFYANQIKSAISNAGTFDPENDDIRFDRPRTVDQVETESFKRWFGDSKAVNEDGRPQLMYVGTAHDITEFRGEQAGAIFVTPSRDFAEQFADRAANREWDGGEILANGQVVMPVFVRAKNPFDYTNALHLNMLRAHLATGAVNGTLLFKDGKGLEYVLALDALIDRVQEGSWLTIESPIVQAAVKSLGHDSFYMAEDGIRNLAVYRPEQLKSAVGNSGDFDPANADIRFDRKRTADQVETESFKRWFGKSKVVDESGKPAVVYHGTGADFDAFNLGLVGDLGVHLGTKRQANFFARGQGGRVIPVYLRLQNPLYLRDTFDSKVTSAQDTIWQLEASRVISQSHATELRALSISNYASGNEGLLATWSAIRTAIESAGYDGVIYDNENEKEGQGISYIAFRPEQIKSAISNEGSFDPQNADIRFDRRRSPTLDGAYAAPNFSAWFGNSKVVDAERRPLMVYHGTDKEFTTFESTPHELKWGDKDLSFQTHYFTDSREVAQTYGRHVMDVHLALENPKVLNARGATWDDYFPFGKIAQAAAGGHDGVIIKRVRDDHAGEGPESTVFVAFNSGQVQSVAKNGNNVQPVTPTDRESAFQAWFGDSIVRDAGGKPLVVYHGTQSDFNTFSKKGVKPNFRNAQKELGFYFADRADYASRYAFRKGDSGGHIMPVYLSLRNPKILPFSLLDEIEEGVDGKPKWTVGRAREFVADLKAAGHDGIIFEGQWKRFGQSPVALREFVVFDANQVKSATGNDGSFSATNADIRFDRTRAFEFDARWTDADFLLDEDGAPALLYRGSVNEDAAAYSENALVYLTPEKEMASIYGRGGAVFPVHVKCRNPFDASRGRGHLLWKRFLEETGAPSYATAASSRGALPYWTMEPQLRAWLDLNEIQYDGIYFAESNRSYSLAVKTTRQLEFALSEPTLRQDLAKDITDTIAFRNWFGKSKMVGHDGKPLVVMHASTYGDFTSFKKDEQRFGKAGFGFYFSDAQGANLFAEYGQVFQADRSFKGEEKAVKVYPVYLKMENPLIVDHVDDLEPYLERRQAWGAARGISGNLTAADKTKLQKMGYDGIITRETTAKKVNRRSGLKVLDRDDPKAVSFPVYVVFEPENVKSAIGNRGTFDPGNPDIRFDRAAATAATSERAAFDSWFAGSQILDADGKAKVVYHGTPAGGFSVFDRSKEGSNTGAADALHGLGGFYFTDSPNVADTYARTSEVEMAHIYETEFGQKSPMPIPAGPSIYPVYLRITNPFRVDGIVTAAVAEEAKAQGHDGIVAKVGEHFEYVAFESHQVKSARGNAGTFDLGNPDIRFDRPQDSPAFARWFKESKVTGRNGEPRIVYHGTQDDFTAFSPEKRGSINEGDSDSELGYFFSSSPDVASSYARRGVMEGIRDETGGNVIPAYLSMQNPKVFDFCGYDYDSEAFYDYITEAIEDGHDGAIIENVADNAGGKRVLATTYVVFRPEQIKSALSNLGTYNPENPDIRFRQPSLSSSWLPAPLVSGPKPLTKVLNPKFRPTVELEAKTVKAMADFFDTKVAVIRTSEDSEFLFNGISFAGAVWIHEKADRPLHTLFGHELLHKMKSERPDLYQGLYDTVVPMLQNEDKFAKAAGLLGKDVEYVREEMIADLVGDRFAEKSFWETVARNAKTTFKETANFVSTTISGLLDRLRGAGVGESRESREFVTDLKKARHAVAEVLGEYLHWKQQNRPTRAPFRDAVADLLRKGWNESNRRKTSPSQDEDVVASRRQRKP